MSYLPSNSDSVSAVISDLMIGADDLTYTPATPNIPQLELLPERISRLNVALPASAMFAEAMLQFAQSRYEMRWLWLAALAALRPLAEAELNVAEAAQITRQLHAGARLS